MSVDRNHGVDEVGQACAHMDIRCLQLPKGMLKAFIRREDNIDLHGAEVMVKVIPMRPAFTESARDSP